MNKITIQIVAIALVALAAGWGVFSSSKSVESDEKIFSEVVRKVSSLEFIKEKIEGSFVIKDGKSPIQKKLPAGVYPTVSFSVDQLIPADYLFNPTEEIEATSNVKFSMENFMDENVSAEIDLIILKQMLFYVKLNKLTGVPMNLSSIEGKWWKVDAEALAKNFAGAEADKLLESSKNSKLSSEQKELLKAIGKKYKSAASFERLPDGSLEGKSAYHWSVSFDKAELANMLKEVIDVVYADSEILPEINNISEIEKALKMVDIKSVDLLIQKRNYLPAQLKISLGILDEKGESLVEVELSAAVSAAKSVQIEAPAESTDILYLMGNLMSSLGGASMLESAY